MTEKNEKKVGKPWVLVAFSNPCAKTNGGVYGWILEGNGPTTVRFTYEDPTKFGDARLVKFVLNSEHCPSRFREEIGKIPVWINHTLYQGEAVESLVKASDAEGTKKEISKMENSFEASQLEYLRTLRAIRDTSNLLMTRGLHIDAFSPYDVECQEVKKALYDLGQEKERAVTHMLKCSEISNTVGILRSTLADMPQEVKP